MTQPSNPQPPPPPPYKPIGIEDVRKVLDSKLVTTGVPGAITGFAISRAFEGDLKQFGYLLGAAVGVWLFIKLGNKLAPKVERAIDQADQMAVRQFNRTVPRITGFQQQYLEALKTHCHNLNIEGYRGRLPRLVLEDVYVPLRVHPETGGGSTLQNRSLKIWDLLPKTDHPDGTFPERLLAVIADPGYGKTTLMRFLTLSFSNQSYTEQKAKELIPVLLLFRNIYKRIQSPTQPSLPQLIVEDVQQLPRCRELRTSEPWFKDQLNHGKCLVMLDGLDEVPEAQRETVSQWANWQMQNYPSQFILTSRPHGYDRDLFDGVQRIDVLDFNNDQKQTFINQWYRFVTWEFVWRPHWEESQRKPTPKRLTEDQARAESEAEGQKMADALSQQLFADRNLTELAKNPLLITIIAATFKANESLPKRRVSLYREIFKLLLEDRPLRRDTRLSITNAEDNQKVLQTLALKLIEAGSTQFSPNQGAEWIRQPLAEVNPDSDLSPKTFLQEIQQISGLLAGGEGYLYEFTHKTFQEYLAAVELSEQGWGQRKVLEHFDDENWKEVVYFFAMLTDPMPFIHKAQEQPLDHPENQYKLELVKRLATDSPRVDAALKQELLTIKTARDVESQNEALLVQHFSLSTRLNEAVEISDYMTWGEYQLFLSDQAAQQFHSLADMKQVPANQADQWVNHIQRDDALWFCAWLSTQTYLAAEDKVYDYRLPTVEELQAVAVEEGGADLPVWTMNPEQPGGALRVVRQRLPERYGNLVNYLASGRWKEADQETDRVMLQVVGQEAEERGYLKLDEIRNFPCEDLRIIDQLWVKFSGGRFGFSVQKQIYVDCGAALDGEYPGDKIWEDFGDRVGWRKDGSWQHYDNLTFDLSISPAGEFPHHWFFRFFLWGVFDFGMMCCSLLSHRDL